MRITRKKTMRKMKKVSGGEYTPVKEYTPIKPFNNVWIPNQNGRKLLFNNNKNINNQMVQVESGNSNNEFTYTNILQQHSPVTRRIARRRIGNLKRESGTRRLPVYNKKSNTVKSTLPALPKPTKIGKEPIKHILTKTLESSQLYKPQHIIPLTFGTPQIAKPI